VISEKLCHILFAPVSSIAGKHDSQKDEFVSLLPKLKSRVADTPGSIAESLSKELARVCFLSSVRYLVFNIVHRVAR